MMKRISFIFFCIFLTACHAQKNVQQRVCQVPEKLMLRPTGLSYQNNKLYVLGQTYGTFYSIDLKNCHTTYIAGGEKDHFVLPINLIYNPQQDQWITEDAAQGLINIKNNLAQGMLGKHNPNNVTKIDNQSFAINNAAVFKLNTNTGDETVISDAHHGSGPLFLDLTSIAGTEDNLFALDYRQKKIFKINPNNGDRSLFIDLTQFKNKGVKAEQPFALASSHQDLFVTDPQAKQIIAIDLKSRQVSVLNSNDTQKNDPMKAPFEMFYDHNNHQLYVSDYAANTIDVLPIIAGQLHAVRHIIVSMKTDEPYPHMVFPVQLMMSQDGNIIVGDERFPGLFEVNPTTGKTVLLTSPEKGKGPLITESIALNQFDSGDILFSDTFFARYYTIDADGNRHPFTLNNNDKIIPADPFCLVHDTKDDFYLSDGGHSRIFKLHFDRNHGIVSSELISGNHKGVGPHYYNLLGMTWVPPLKRLAVASNQGFSHTAPNDLLLVDPVTGNRTLLSGKGRGAGPQFKYVADAFYVAPDMLYVTDSFRPALYRVDIKTGDRTIVSGKEDNGQWIGQGPAFKVASMVTVASDGENAYVTDARKDAIFSINLKTGDRRIVASGLP